MFVAFQAVANWFASIVSFIVNLEIPSGVSNTVFYFSSLVVTMFVIRFAFKFINLFLVKGEYSIVFGRRYGGKNGKDA